MLLLPVYILNIQVLYVCYVFYADSELSDVNDFAK